MSLEKTLKDIEKVLDGQSCTASLYEVSDDDFGMLYHLIHKAQDEARNIIEQVTIPDDR